LRESATDIRKLMDIYARGGGRSVTQPALPGEAGTSKAAPAGATQEVLVDGKVTGHVVNGKYVPINK
jgi:hypothetical protein